MANLIRVLEATLKGPWRSSQRPTRSRPHTDQASTASAGDQHRFQPGTGRPPGRMTTNPKISRGRANRSTAVRHGDGGAGRANRWSGRGFEGDLVAEGLELPDVVALLAVGADAGVVELGAEVVEAGVGVGQQVPDDDQDRAADRDDGLLLSPAAGDAPVAFAEKGVGLGGGDGGLA